MPAKILLAARERDVRERLRLALERLEASGDPVTFMETGDGLEAFALAEAEHPDLVVIEVGVTPYGAFGLTRDIKATPGLSCPVVIILERPQDEWLARWAGADALVHKPVDPFALAQVARKLLEERSVAASAS